MYYIQPSLASDNSIVCCQECFLYTYTGVGLSALLVSTTKQNAKAGSCIRYTSYALFTIVVVSIWQVLVHFTLPFAIASNSFVHRASVCNGFDCRGRVHVLVAKLDVLQVASAMLRGLPNCCSRSSPSSFMFMPFCNLTV